MGSKLGKEGPGCDEAETAAVEGSGDSGGGAPPPSPSPSPTPSTPPSPNPWTSATPRSPTPTPSSPSPPRSSRPTSSSSSPSPSPQSPTTSTSSSDEEIAWGEEQGIDQLKESFGSTHPDCTYSEIRKIEKDDSGGVLNNKFKLGEKEPVLTLDNFNDDIITGKIMLLSKKYGFFRRIAGDGSCFYRAFIFSYLENVVETKDEAKRKAEAARLRQRVEKYMLACYSYDEDLLPAFYGFESVVNLIEQGLASGELYRLEMNEHVTSQILPLLRSLTEIEICTRENYYHAFLEECYESVFELCFFEVRPWNGEANHMQITTLVNALGIPIVVENLNRNSPGRLNPNHIYPSRESEAEALELEQSVDSDDSTTPMAQAEHAGCRNLSPAERRRLVTLLYRPGHYDIIYPK